jgi:hypothetical protein
MRKLTLLLAASTLIAAAIASPASAGSFNPFHVVRDAVDIGLDTRSAPSILGSKPPRKWGRKSRTP